MNGDNPYRQPDAELVSGERLQELAVHGPVHRPAGHGLDWLADAWALFRARPLAWVLAALSLWLVTLVVNLALAFIPFLGGIVQWLLYPVFAVGLLHLAHSMDRGEGLEIGGVFAGFRHQTGSLMGLGGLYILFFIVLGITAAVMVFVLFGGDFFGQVAGSGQGQALSAELAGTSGLRMAFMVLVLVMLMLVMIGGMWFAPALVYFGEVHPARAILQSLGALLRNIPALIVYMLALAGFAILLLLLPVLAVMAAAMLAGASPVSFQEVLGQALSGVVGLSAMLALVAAYVVIMIVAILSVYTAFRDIFIAPSSR